MDDTSSMLREWLKSHTQDQRVTGISELGVVAGITSPDLEWIIKSQELPLSSPNQHRGIKMNRS